MQIAGVAFAADSGHAVLPAAASAFHRPQHLVTVTHLPGSWLLGALHQAAS
jgi:hypothetical protein